MRSPLVINPNTHQIKDDVCVPLHKLSPETPYGATSNGPSDPPAHDVCYGLIVSHDIAAVAPSTWRLYLVRGVMKSGQKKGNGQEGSIADHCRNQKIEIKHIVIFGAAGAIAIALMGLLGYVPGLQTLGRINKNYIPMAPSTAASFIILGATIVTLSIRPPSRAMRSVLAPLITIVSIFGALVAIGHLAGTGLDLEKPFVPERGSLGEIPIGRMSPSTGAVFFIAGLAVLLLAWKPQRRPKNHRLMNAVGCLGSLVLVIGLIYCLSYIYGSPLLYGKGATVPMALTTALAFMMLGTATVAASGEDAIPLNQLMGNTTRSHLLRAFLPLVILSVLLGSITTIHARSLISINPAIISSISAVYMAILTAFIVTWVATRIGSSIDNAKTELKASQAKYLEIFENIQDVYYETHIDGRVIEISPSVDHLLDYTRKELIGSCLYDLYFNPEEQDRLINTLIEHQVINDDEIILKDKSGALHTCSNTGKLITDTQGNPVKIVGSLRDMTKRKNTEEKLQFSTYELSIRNRINEVFLSTTDELMYDEILVLILDFMKSDFGVFAYIDQHGDAVVPTMTRHVWDQCQVADKTIVFPRTTWGESSWVRCIKEKRTLYSNSPSTDVPKGHIDITRNVSAPIIHRDQVVGFLQVANKASDYTKKDVDLFETIANIIAPILDARLKKNWEAEALQRAEENLRKEAARSTLLLDLYLKAPNLTDKELYDYALNKAVSLTQSTVGFVHHVSDDQNTISLTTWNSGILETCTSDYDTHYPIDEAGNWVDCVRLKQPVIYNDFKNSPNQKGQPAGHPAIHRFMSIPVTVGDKIHCVFGIGNKPVDYEEHDLTQIRLIGNELSKIMKQRIAEKELETLHVQLVQSQKMESVGRLAGGVAHDYNNALSVVIGFTELTIEEVDPFGPLRSNLDEILGAAKRAADITRQLLAFARKQTIAPKVLDLNENVEEMLKMLRHLIGEDIDLVWSPGNNLQPVKMDPSQIDQIMVNLCVNARDAIEGIGKVTIETGNAIIDHTYCTDHTYFTPGQFVMLVVSDNGCGMDKNIQKNIFEPFFTTKKLDEGTGLGLATVYGIVKQNNGFINVYSEPDQGTTIRIYFPRHEGEMGDAKKKSPDTIPMAHGETILLVEDDMALLNLSKKILNSLGYIVIPAATPEEAMHLADEHRGEVHLLVTDVIMPEMNGRELAEKLKTRYPQLKCMFMSGYTADVIAHHGVLDDHVHFIQKPFSKRDLAIVVKKVLDD